MIKSQSVLLRTSIELWTDCSNSPSPATDQRSWYAAGTAKRLPGIDVDDLIAELCNEDASFAAGMQVTRAEVAHEYLSDTQSLSTLRMQAGLSQKELAAAAQTSQPAIARLEKGETDPRLTTLRKLAEVLNCDVETLNKAIKLKSTTEDE